MISEEKLIFNNLNIEKLIRKFKNGKPFNQDTEFTPRPFLNYENY